MVDLVAGWRRRVQAVRQARRAYAKALHLNPAQAGAWKDAAFAYHHESQVRSLQLPHWTRVSARVSPHHFLCKD